MRLWDGFFRKYLLFSLSIDDRPENHQRRCRAFLVVAPAARHFFDFADNQIYPTYTLCVSRRQSMPHSAVLLLIYAPDINFRFRCSLRSHNQTHRVSKVSYNLPQLRFYKVPHALLRAVQHIDYYAILELFGRALNIYLQILHLVFVKCVKLLLSRLLYVLPQLFFY